MNADVCLSCRYRIDSAGRCCCVLPWGVSIPEVHVALTAAGFIVMAAALWVHVSLTLLLAGCGVLLANWPVGIALAEVQRRRQRARALSAARGVRS